MSEEAENWCPATILPNVDRGVCPSFPKKMGWPTAHPHHQLSNLNLSSNFSPLRYHSKLGNFSLQRLQLKATVKTIFYQVPFYLFKLALEVVLVPFVLKGGRGDSVVWVVFRKKLIIP